MIEVIKATFGANETKQFLINGAYFELLQAAYPIDVVLTDKQGAQRSNINQAEASYFNAPGAFEVVQITSANAQDVRFFVGDGSAGTRRVAGEVSVIDGGKAQTLANRACIIDAGQLAVSGQYTHVQLWNPVGSGKRVIVKSITSRTLVNGTLALAFYGTALATLLTTKTSKLSGGAAPVAEPRVTTNATTLFANKFAMSMVANNPFDHEFAEPIIVTPGYGLSAYHTTVNADLGVMFDCIEETI